MWNCVCDCRNNVTVDSDHLKSGHSKSCGCITKKHGMFGTRIYKIWSGMKDRCYNENLKSYKDYGGRGITVCDEWRNNSQAFYDWSIANGYADDLTIDRIDNMWNLMVKHIRYQNGPE